MFISGKVFLMARKNASNRIKSLTALVLLTGVLACACDTVPSDSAETSETETTTVTETTQEWIEETETTTEATTTTSETTTAVVTSVLIDDSERDIGYGAYGFQIGSLIFHSQNDISMMIQQEDATVYDFEARKCDYWIDAFYINDSFDMEPLDASYRFLTIYNNDTSVNFSGYYSIGEWTTPKGSDLELYLAEITIISDNLVIRILPKYPSDPDYYNVSINGRGYYASIDQLQMMDFVLSSLAEEPGVDPLEGIFSSVDHTYYF